MMKRILMLCLLLIMASILVGCSEKVTCYEPYMPIGPSCCLDQDSNGICDSDPNFSTADEINNSKDTFNKAEFNSFLKKELNLYSQIIEEEGLSISSIKSTQNLIKLYYEQSGEFRSYLKTIEDPKLVDLTTKYLDSSEKAIKIHEEYIDYLVSFNSIANEINKNDHSSELYDAIYNCGCNKIKCEEFYQDTLKSVQFAEKTWTEIALKYDLSFAEVAAVTHNKTASIYIKELPELIRESKRYNENSCYKINDEYQEYISRFDEVQYVTDDEYADEVNEKWINPINQLVAQTNLMQADIEAMLGTTTS